MRKKIQQGKRQKGILRTRVLLVCAVISGAVFITSVLLVLLNMNNLSKIKASATGNEGGGSDISNGEIISEFTWEKDPVTYAILGPDAISCEKDAHSMPGGSGSTNGLSAGPNGNDVNFEIEGHDIFKQDGIDISIDFRRNEQSGEFFTRGNVFNFGMTNGYITISYCVINRLGITKWVRAKTEYEIPIDPVYRTYRFLYSPSTGKGEIFVNNIIVWQNEGENNSALNWKNGGNIIIGKNLNGGGVDRAFLDNLVIRSAGSVTPLAESLLNFMLEPKDGGVKVHWSSSANIDVDYFTLERSDNGKDFKSIAKIWSKRETGDESYTYIDPTKPTTNLVYYKLSQTFSNGKHVSHTLSALKIKTEKDLSIERVSPTPFEKTCDISYFLPKSGRVWMQITNSKGKIVKTHSFEAPQGKNVYVYKDDHSLESGTYTFSFIFENKKVSRQVVKW